jgi:F420H(2)-dependent quinone reductase
LEDEKLYLLPVLGSDTQWYKNVLKNPSIRIDARGAEAKLQAVPITDPERSRPWSRNSATSAGPTM